MVKSPTETTEEDKSASYDESENLNDEVADISKTPAKTPTPASPADDGPSYTIHDAYPYVTNKHIIAAQQKEEQNQQFSDEIIKKAEEALENDRSDDTKSVTSANIDHIHDVVMPMGNAVIAHGDSEGETENDGDDGDLSTGGIFGISASTLFFVAVGIVGLWVVYMDKYRQKHSLMNNQTVGVEMEDQIV